MNKLRVILTALLFVVLTGCIGVESERALLNPGQAVMPLQSGNYLRYKRIGADKGVSWALATKEVGSLQSPFALSADKTNKKYTFNALKNGRDVEYTTRFFLLKDDWHILEVSTSSGYLYVLVNIEGANGSHFVAYEGEEINCVSMSEDGTLQKLGLKVVKTLLKWKCVPNSNRVNLRGYFNRMMDGKLYPMTKIELERKK